MSNPGSPRKTITVILIFAAGLLPLAAWFWIGVVSLATTTIETRGQHLQHLAEVKRKLLQDHFAQQIADVRLLAQAVRIMSAPPITAPVEKTCPPVEKVCPPVENTPPPITTQPPVASSKGNEQAVILRDSVIRLARSFLQRQLDDVGLLAANNQLAMGFAGIDWVFRQNNRQAKGEKWIQVAETFAPWLNTFQKVKNYDDLYLVSIKGDIVFTTTRGPELGANIGDPGLKGSSLYRLFPRALKQASLEDFSPGNDRRAAAFLGAPIRRDNQLIGIIVLKFSPQHLLEPIFSERPASPSGAMAIVGPEGTLRFKDNSWSGLPTPLPTPQFLPKNVLSQTRGEMVLEGSGFQLAWEHFKVNQLDWILLAATPPEKESFEPPIVVSSAAGSASAPPAPTDHAPNDAETAKNATTPAPIVPLPAAAVAIPPPPVDPPPVGPEFGKDYLDITGYYDLFLIRPDGHVFHTATQQVDLGTNLIDGPYADTNLGKLFKSVLKTQQPELSDIAPYPPSRNEPAAFLAAPVFVGGKVAQVVALQRPLESMSALLDPGGLTGPNGDIVLVGSDNRMRSDSFSHPLTHSITTSFRGSIAENGMDNQAVRQALAGEQGLLTTPLPDGGQRLTAYLPVTVGDLSWALLASEDSASPWSMVSQAGSPLWMLIGGSIVGIGLLAFLVTTLEARPWNQLGTVVMHMAKGRTEILHEPPWDHWRETMEPLRLVMERTFQQVGRLHSSTKRISGLYMRLSPLLEGLAKTNPKVTTTNTSDTPEALLEALSRWHQLPAVSTPSAIVKETDALGRKIVEHLTRIQDSANQINLLAINTASLAARASTKKNTLVETYQKVRELSETITQSTKEGSETALSWKEKLDLAARTPKIDEILAALLSRVENMLKIHAQLARDHHEDEDDNWDSARTLLGEISTQMEKLQHVVESLPTPHKDANSPDSLPDPGASLS